MGIVVAIADLLLLLANAVSPSAAVAARNPFGEETSSSGSGDGHKRRELIELDGGPDDLAWIVQLSDLHFSVHHSDRAQDFRNIVAPTVSLINPSLVLLTGDLTDGKSKDLLIMKPDEYEWIEYHKVMNDVINGSGLDKRIFYDVRGNHDNFGVPEIGGSFDFYSKYSINGQLQRSGRVNSITLQTSKRKLLFVGFDSTMSTGLRGPTNLFGHPTDELLEDLNSELLQWDSQPTQPITKISFGHFPLSFSAASKSGKTLQDVFTTCSLDAYICGHLHTKFGKNLKRHHHCGDHAPCSQQLFQLNGYRTPSHNASSCSKIARRSNEFWEWEMGDWRKSRSMRILAVDNGYISSVDVDFRLGAKKTIILPTFPLDSRFTSTSTLNYKCDTEGPSSHGWYIRALVFSSSPIVSVLAKVYDSKHGQLIVVLETLMTKLEGSRGDVYVAPWNAQAFEDHSPERYLLQIVATDGMGRSTTSELRPFSVTGAPAKVPWSWKEFLVMGCQWDSLYHPILWFFYFLVLSILLIPKAFLCFSRRQFTYKNFKANKSFVNCISWIFVELHNLPVAWYSMTCYLFYLLLCPWFYGQVFTDGTDRAYMTYRGWVLRSNDLGTLGFLGSPDVMVVVLMHLYVVVLPMIVTIIALSAERGVYQEYLLSLSSKKKDDYDKESSLSSPHSYHNNGSSGLVHWRCLRKILMMASMAIIWRHFKSCRALVMAYELNPIIHFPIYAFTVPLLLVYSVWKTGRNRNGISTR